jgi:ATP-dependent exoDNAse (exonuclease V) beta subunit
MGAGTLTIYSASAGSGKTFRLAGNYLAALFRSRYQYRKILAVTFTNKATAEMKGRILEQLDRLASGRHLEYLKELTAGTGKSEQILRAEAKEILFSILHDYSRFSVCTIDAFFQKIIRAFTIECGLNSWFSMEIDHSIVLTTAVDEMIASSAEDHNLKNWLLRYILSNLDEEKSWNIKDSIIRLSEELFKEKFKILSSDEIANLKDKDFLLRYIEKLHSIKYSFEEKMIDLGRNAVRIFSEYQLTDEMFFNKSRGVPGYIRSLSEGRIAKPGDKVRAILSDPPRWSTGNPHPLLQRAVDECLDTVLREAITLYDKAIVNYNTANSLLQNLFALGILSDVLRKVHEVATEGNIFLISDAGELLSLITKGDQTPFIYEKIGSKYENYMIDEFQDTSILQWNNFQPLIDNCMAEGHDNMVVGDVKQSIYRFRNSDWKILGNMLVNGVDGERIKSESLNYNYRSRSNIISFNNSFFSVIPDMIDQNFPENPVGISFSRLYREAIQSDPGRSAGGYVRLDFIEDDDPYSEPESNDSSLNEEDKKNESGAGWKAKVLQNIPVVIETFLDKGYNASDIGILVRDGREGAEVMKAVIEYSGRYPENMRARNFNIVSNDSLLFSKSNVITFIISVLKVIIDPEDFISRAVMLRYYLYAKEAPVPDSITLFREDLISGSEEYLPEGYGKFLEKAEKMTLFDAIESIIDFFGVGNYSWNVPYIIAFMDIILEYSKSKDVDFMSFIDWWELAGEAKSVILPSGLDAIRILTIHKSKGLEFPVVILPFLSWNLDHRPSKRPVIWTKPGMPPFNDLGIVPVKYSSELSETIFEADYNAERFHSFLDNVNLLYVAMTRAVDALYGFIPGKPGPLNGIAKIIKEAIQCNNNPAGESGFVLSRMLNTERKVFEFGEVPVKENKRELRKYLTLNSYKVNKRPESLRLKLHAGNYLGMEGERIREMAGYGTIMHEVFAGISCRDDIPDAVGNLVLEGKIDAKESTALIERLNDLISDEMVSSWFDPGNVLMKETGILLPSGGIRRPDRIIIRDGNALVIDFKFGNESPSHEEQISLYRTLLEMMGYVKVEAFLWYVDRKKIKKI